MHVRTAEFWKSGCSLESMSTIRFLIPALDAEKLTTCSIDSSGPSSPLKYGLFRYHIEIQIEWQFFSTYAMENVASGNFNPDPSRLRIKFVSGIFNGFVKVIVAVTSSSTLTVSFSI